MEPLCLEQRQSSIRSFEFAVAAGYSIKDPSKLVSVDKSKLSHKQKEKRKKPLRKRSTKCLWQKLHTSLGKQLHSHGGQGRISDITIWNGTHGTQRKALTVHTQKRDKRVCYLNDLLIGGGILGKNIKR